MGTANKVPGISGGVVAYVGGFYEEFIYSLQKLNLKALKLLLTGRFGIFLIISTGGFYSLLILGEALSYFTVSKGFVFTDTVLPYFSLGHLFLGNDIRLHLLHIYKLWRMDSSECTALNHWYSYRSRYFPTRSCKTKYQFDFVSFVGWSVFLG